jgi:hypothetical protein
MQRRQDAKAFVTAVRSLCNSIKAKERNKVQGGGGVRDSLFASSPLCVKAVALRSATE